MSIITTFEHAYLTQNDFPNPQDFDWLIEQNFDGFQIGRKNHQWQIKVRHYIGIIGLPSGQQLEILPKISAENDIAKTRQWLQVMLTDIWQSLIPKKLPNISQQKTINNQLPLNDWLKQLFWQRFQTYQPNQHYQRFEQNQAFLQGKLLVKQQLQHNAHQPHKFFHQSENFAFDTACNRLIKTTIQQMIGILNSNLANEWQSVSIVPSNQYQTTFNHAQQELHALPSVIAQQNFAFIHFCYSLLTFYQGAGHGESHSQSLLINMQFAFEKWVTYKIKQQFSGQDFEILQQFSQPLTLDNALTLKPDILIKSENFVKVIDIKWKTIERINDIQLADMYQLMTYASEFDADEAWLVVPTFDKQKTQQEIVLANPKTTKFYLVPFCVYLL